MKIALCSFNFEVGWRIVAISQSDLGVFRFGRIRLLRVPIDSTFRAGRFCNPRRMLWPMK